jgi:MATE family multidrug resistance protein
MSHATGRAIARRELRATFVLALPLVLGQLAAMLMGVVDSVLAGHHGLDTLAAVTVGSSLWNVALFACVGLMMAIPPSVAQLVGAGRRDQVAELWHQALWIALATGVLLAFATWHSPRLLDAIGIVPEIRPPAAGFLHAIAFGAPALSLFFCLRYLAEGLAHATPGMFAGFGGLLALVPLGYALMFGFGPIPALGATGLGIATAIILWGQVLGLGAYLLRARDYADLGLFARYEPPHWPTIRGLLALGLPMGVSIFMEGSLFVATALLIGRLGALDVAAHQIALNVASLCFMLPLGLAMATTVRVGQAAGAGDHAGVRRAAFAGYGLGALTQALAAAVLLLGGPWISRLYTDQVAVGALAVLLMRYAALFQLPDGIQVLSNGVLRGLKDTRVPMLVTVLAYWGVGLPLGAWFGLHLNGRAPGLWIGLILGLAVAAAGLGWRVHARLRSPRP